jgi:hypothetical protein
LREAIPGLRRLAILANVANVAVVLEMRDAQAAARTLGYEVITMEIRQPRISHLCAYCKSIASILVMQSTRDRTAQNASCCLGGT